MSLFLDIFPYFDEWGSEVIMKLWWGIVDKYGENHDFLGKTFCEMFIGEYQHNLDSKGRMAVPVKFRREVGNGAIVTRGLDRCLFVFSAKEWEILAQKLNAMPFAKSDARAFARLMLAGAMDAEIDKQGRVLIPDYLRAYAGLKKQVIVAGVYSRMEIWDLENWRQYKSKIESSSDEIAEKLGELGI